MRLFYSKDGLHYRRWVNVLPALLLSGASQYLSGRKKAGIIWLLAFYLVSLLAVVACLYPGNPYTLDSDSLLTCAGAVVCLVALAEGFRRPIPVLGFKKGILAFLLILLVAGGPAFLLRTVLFQPFRIPTDSMTPTLLGGKEGTDGSVTGGDRIFVNKAAYLINGPRRGDLVVFKSNPIPGLNYVPKTLNLKRVAGLPGETISLQPPYLLINGEKVTEPPFFLKMGERSGAFTGYTFSPKSRFLISEGQRYLLKADEYFVLGDNSPNSSDSRHFGPVKRVSIIGQALYLYSPAERKGFIE